MIIIPIPKSASTSLFYLVSVYFVMHKIIDEKEHSKRENRYLHIVDDTKAYHNGRFWDRKIPNDCKYLYSWHRDVVEININDVKRIERNDLLFKNHIPPTENNLKLLKGVKKIILLRNPDDVILAYKRAFDRDIPKGSFFNTDVNFCRDMSEYNWIKKSKDVGLVDDLWKFYKGWMDTKHLNDALFITYQEVLDDITKVINKIFKYYDINIEVEDAVLPKLLYTRNRNKGVIVFGG